MSSYYNSSKFASLDDDFIPVKSKSNNKKQNSFKPFDNLISSNNTYSGNSHSAHYYNNGSNNTYSGNSRSTPSTNGSNYYNNSSSSNSIKTYTKSYKYDKLSRSVKDRFTYIISKSSNNFKLIESALIELYNSLTENSDKCSLIELILSYSLHELVQSKELFFGKIIYDNFSVYNEDNLDKLKLKDGYTLFAYSVWISFDKDNNISRTQTDIISTVYAMLNLDVNPFKLGKKKKETIFGTMDICIEKSKITSSTYSSICELIFTKKYNSELFFGKYLNQILSTSVNFDTKFMHNVLIFGLLNDSNRDLFKSLYNYDINSLGLLMLNTKTGTIVDKNLYFTNVLKVMKSFDFNQSGFKNFFSNTKDMKRNFHLLKVSLANFYIESVISDNSANKFAQHDISNGSSFTSDGKHYFKFLEIIGFFIDEVSAILDSNSFDELCLSKFDIKVQIGYGISKFMNSKTHRDYLTKLYESDIHIRNKMLIGSIIGINVETSTTKNSDNNKSTVQKEEKKELCEFRVNSIGLDKLVEGEISSINFKKDQLSPAIDDFFYKLSIYLTHNNSNKISNFDVAKEILYKLFELVCKKYQVELVSDFLAYMHQKNLIKKDDLKKVLSLNKDEITDFFSCDNMFFNNIINSVESC